MKYLCIFGLLILFSNSIAAQTKVQNEVAIVVEKLRNAMVDADKLSLEYLVSDSLSYGHSSGRLENKIEFIGNIINGKSDFVSIEISEQSIYISKNTAIIRHILNAETNDNGNPGKVKLKVLQVWIKEKKIWKLIARQAVKLV